MKRNRIGRGLLFSLFCIFHVYAHAQNENTRAANWYTLQRLTNLASLDSSFLSVSEKSSLANLLVDHSPASVCTTPSTTPCDGSAALPITGLHLTGDRESPAMAKLDWETKAEYNSKIFVLERQSSTDPMQYDSVWSTPGKGTSYGPVKYTYTDVNSNPVTTYYRVKEVDTDEHSTWSNIVAIEGVASRLTVVVAPNPAARATAGFYVVGTSPGAAGFIISNAAGQVVVRKSNLALSGNTYVPLGGYNLSNGFYIVTLFTSTERVSEKFIIY